MTIGNYFVTANILRHDIIIIYNMEVALRNNDGSFKVCIILYILSYVHSRDNGYNLHLHIHNPVVFFGPANIAKRIATIFYNTCNNSILLMDIESFANLMIR